MGGRDFNMGKIPDVPDCHGAAVPILQMHNYSRLELQHQHRTCVRLFYACTVVVFFPRAFHQNGSRPADLM